MWTINKENNAEKKENGVKRYKVKKNESNRKRKKPPENLRKYENEWKKGMAKRMKIV